MGSTPTEGTYDAVLLARYRRTIPIGQSTGSLNVCGPSSSDQKHVAMLRAGKGAQASNSSSFTRHLLGPEGRLARATRPSPSSAGIAQLVRATAL